MKKEQLQTLLSELEPASAQILFTALLNANDEGFFSFVRDNFTPIKAWLQSDEFRQNFAHLPYPPLLNPSTVEVDASKHCADLAWNLNLPISSAFNGGGGNKLKFIYICPHGVGAAAFVQFLWWCDVFCPPSWNMHPHAKERYAEAFMHLANPQKGDYAIMIAELDVLFLDKYLHLLPKNIPIIHGLRDPIGILKHSIGRNWDKHNIEFKHDFTLSYDWRNFIEIIKHREYEVKVDFDGMAKGSFISAVLLPYFDTSKIYPLDMRRLENDVAFDTLIELATRFNFNPPPQSKKAYFSTKEFRGYVRYLVPLMLWAKKGDKIFSPHNAPDEINPTWIKPEKADECFFFRIDRNTGENEGVVNIIAELSEHSIKKDLGVYMTQEQEKNLKKDEEFWEQVRGYLCEFIEAIALSTDEAEENIFSEEDTLEWLKVQDSKLLLKLKVFFEVHMKFFKENFPEIVASWDYYIKFKRLCEKL